MYIFSVIDTGGVFRNVTETFWQNIKLKRFIGGKLFDGDQLYLIQQNSDIIEWMYPQTTVLAKYFFGRGYMLAHGLSGLTLCTFNILSRVTNL